jgi:hypothetical protein
MNTITPVVKRHRLVTFFALAYAISYVFYFLPSILPGLPFLFPFGSAVAGAGDRIAVSIAFAPNQSCSAPPIAQQDDA